MSTNIAWTNATWNPVAGCTRVSPGCDNCYAAALAAGRLKNHPTHQGLAVVTLSGRPAFNGTIRLLPERLDKPLRWREPRMIFVNSMSDLFHPMIPDEFIDRVFGVMGLAGWHHFQVLTKRPERMLAYASDPVVGPRVEVAARRIHRETCRACAKADERGVLRPHLNYVMMPWPLPHVWLGVSVEDQRNADERIPLLLETPAAVRFLSCEPLLGPIDLTKVRHDLGGGAFVGGSYEVFNALYHKDSLNRGHPRPGLDWVIAGGESGPDHRTMGVNWLRELRDQCHQYGVPFFAKQDSGSRPGKQGHIPDELWVQEFPQTREPVPA